MGRSLSVVEGDAKAPFSLVAFSRTGEGTFRLLIMLFIFLQTSEG